MKAAGFEVRAAVEIDPVAARSYALNLGYSPIVKDIRQVTGRQIMRAGGLRSGECFLLAACPPCQGFSTQRRQGDGANDPRNLLIFEFVRMVKEIRPTYFLLENVPGLAKGIGAPFYRTTLLRLRRLGYGVVDGVLDAADYGVPQRRARLIAVGWRSGATPVGLPPATHGESKVTKSDGMARPRWRTVRDAISHLRGLRAGEADASDPLHAASGHSASIIKRITAIPRDGGSRAQLPKPLVLQCHIHHDGHRDVYGRMRWDSPSPTLTGGCNKPSKGRFIHPYQHRGITLREAALLQNFPRRSRFAGTRGEAADQIGNAVPPGLVKAVVRAIRRGYQDPTDRSHQRRRRM